jgi:uncharacterized protein with HEPN domain
VLGFLDRKAQTGANALITAKRLVIVGEAAVVLGKTYQTKYPEVPWPRLIPSVNRLVHAYFDLDMELVWGIASNHLDELRRVLQTILETEFSDEVDPEPAP